MEWTKLLCCVSYLYALHRICVLLFLPEFIRISRLKRMESPSSWVEISEGKAWLARVWFILHIIGRLAETEVLVNNYIPKFWIRTWFEIWFLSWGLSSKSVTYLYSAVSSTYCEYDLDKVERSQFDCFACNFDKTFPVWPRPGWKSGLFAFWNYLESTLWVEDNLEKVTRINIEC